MSRRLATAALLLAVAAAVAGCSGGGTGGSGGGDAEGSSLTVYAASSLTATFEQLGRDFEKANDGVEVRFNFAGSADLVSQLRSGAPADVFASADEATMERILADDLNGSDPVVFATNRLEIAVPPTNPAGVASLQDLTRSGLDLVVCAPEVPCGAAAQAVAVAAGVTLRPVSEEQSVTDVLGKVTTGEADAGLVYVTDVIAAGDDVQGIEFAESRSAVNRYPIVTLADSPDADLARAFVALVLSEDGRRLLTDAGFGGP